MNRTLISIIITLLGALLPAAGSMQTAAAGSAQKKIDSPQITQAELVRRTQQLFDSLVPGDQKPWREYYADDCIFADEKGRKFGKTELVADISPMPPGYSGVIKLVNVESRIIDATAVLSYDIDESETVFGQQLRARYHQIDTWMYRNHRWQILASQVHRYYEDPAPGEIDPKLLDAYAGTYELAPGVTMTVTKEGDQLFAQRSGRTKMKLVPEATGIFFRPGVEGRMLFHIAANGTADRLIDRRNNEDLIWKRIAGNSP